MRGSVAMETFAPLVFTPLALVVLTATTGFDISVELGTTIRCATVIEPNPTEVFPPDCCPIGAASLLPAREGSMAGVAAAWISELIAPWPVFAPADAPAFESTFGSLTLGSV